MPCVQRPRADLSFQVRVAITGFSDGDSGPWAGAAGPAYAGGTPDRAQHTPRRKAALIQPILLRLERRVSV